MPCSVRERMLRLGDNLVISADGESKSRITSRSLPWVKGKIVGPKTERDLENRKRRKVMGNALILFGELLSIWGQKDHKGISKRLLQIQD